jgi:deazaflavin-dependent oxidoreductase (nitroreductase family)
MRVVRCGWVGLYGRPLWAYIPNRKKIEMSPDLQKLAQEDFCYLTTTGRISGRPHTIEIWFALNGQTLYMLSGGRDKSDWVKNALHIPAVQVKINSTILSGQARHVNNSDEDTLARKIVFEKYVPRSSDDLVDWSRTSLPIAVDISG